MKIKNDNDIISIYMAYYNEILIAISKDKKFLINYMRYNRCLKDNQYRIEKELINESYLYSKYENYILNEFYNLWIPQIDINIIEMEYNDLINDMSNTINKLKYYVFLINRIEKTKGDTEIFLDAINKLTEYSNKEKVFNKLNKYHMLSHPIIKCNIEDYFKILYRYNEMKSMNEKFRYLCSSD